MTKLLVMMMVLAMVGCVVETGDDAPAESEVEQDITGIAPPGLANVCAYSGGYNWCQDWYSKKWCTNSHPASGWDLVHCDWSGWNSSGNYCGNPTYYPDHEWGQAHTHCD